MSLARRPKPTLTAASSSAALTCWMAKFARASSNNKSFSRSNFSAAFLNLFPFHRSPSPRCRSR